ncbi:MAG: BatD family protein [Bacteroidota bacterium]
MVRSSWWLVLVGSMVLAGSVFAQNVRVSASASPNPAGQNDQVLFSVELRGDLTSVGEIEPPSTQGLSLVLPTPQQSYTYQNYNGRTEHVLTLTWIYRPLKTGRATFSAVQVPVGNERYTTDPITVDIVPQGQRPPPAAHSGATSSQHGRTQSDEPPTDAKADLFVRATPPRVRAYVGEQVVVDYVLTYDPVTVQPRDVQILGPWDAEGLWREELEVPDRATLPRQDTIDGRELRVVTAKRVALFPARTGTLTVEPVAFEVGTYRGTPQRGLFRSPFFSDFERETIESEPITIEAVPLPDGAPASFNGGVGAFTMQISLDDRALRDGIEAGEPIRMEVEVRGTGNLATLPAPAWDAPDGVAVYPPSAEEFFDRRSAPLRGRKVFVYTLVPQRGGRLELPPVRWTYFDPEAERYQTLVSDPVPLDVNGPAGTIPEAGVADAEVVSDAEAVADLLPLARWTTPRLARPLHRSVWFWGAVGTPLLALLGLALFVRRREARAASPEARRRQALADATTRLDAARQAADPRTACAEAERAVRSYLAARFAVPAQALPRDALSAALDTAPLHAQGLTDDHRRALIEALAAAERVQYAPDQARAADAVVARTRAAIEGVHEATPAHQEVPA